MNEDIKKSMDKLIESMRGIDSGSIMMICFLQSRLVLNLLHEKNVISYEEYESYNEDIVRISSYVKERLSGKV